MSNKTDSEYKAFVFLNQGDTFPYTTPVDSLQGLSIKSTLAVEADFVVTLTNGKILTISVVPGGIWTGYFERDISTIDTASTGFKMEIMRRSR